MTHVVVWTTLASGEHGIVYSLLKILGMLKILPEENQPGAGTSESLVAFDAMSTSDRQKLVRNVRRGSDNIAILKWVV